MNLFMLKTEIKGNITKVLLLSLKKTVLKENERKDESIEKTYFVFRFS